MRMFRGREGGRGGRERGREEEVTDVRSSELQNKAEREEKEEKVGGSLGYAGMCM